MRRLLPALLPLLLVPLAAAHGGGEFPHVNPLTVDLAPGANRTLELTFLEGGPGGKFDAGWVFVLHGALARGSAPMQVELRPGHLTNISEQVAGQWTFAAPGKVETFTGPMPVTDVYTLVFRNRGAQGNASLTFFYDQSCNCAAKPIPIEVPGGLVVFNADVKKGATWRATFPEPAVHSLEVSLAERTSEASRWPQDFRVLNVSREPVVRDVGKGPARLHEMAWTADKEQRYYLFVRSVAQNTSRFDTSSPAMAVGSVMVAPYFEQLGAGEAKRTPLPHGMAPLALAGAAFALAARRRS